MRLTDFRVLTFDCYGTLIDWESGLWSALRPLAERANLGREAALTDFAETETAQERETPGMLYAEVLRHVFLHLATRWRVDGSEEQARQFAASITDWPAFPDSAEALRRLSSCYRLVILSNVDHRGIAASLPKLGVRFDAVVTAQDVGLYKPDQRNFAALIAKVEALGLRKQDILHTAQSLFHDHAPANAAGLASCWIDRRGDAEGWGATAPPPGGVRWDFRFNSLAAMADAVEKEKG